MPGNGAVMFVPHITAPCSFVAYQSWYMAAVSRCTPLLCICCKALLTHKYNHTKSIAASTAAPPCNRHLPASQPLIFWFTSAALRLINFDEKRSGVPSPCRPSSFRCASLFSRGGCGSRPIRSGWHGGVVAGGNTSSIKKYPTLMQASQRFIFYASCVPANGCSAYLNF